MILFLLVVGYVVSLEVNEVYYGVYFGDYVIYLDCWLEFVEKMNDVCYIVNYILVDIVSFYLKVSKIDIFIDGLKMGLDYGLIWICYNGWEKVCGKCGVCEECLEVFCDNNVIDFFEYEVY